MTTLRNNRLQHIFPEGNIKLEVIHHPVKQLKGISMERLKNQLQGLYREQHWTISREETEETLNEAAVIINIKNSRGLCGFFSARRGETEGYGSFYYLERLIISQSVRYQALVPLAAELLLLLPEFGKEKLTICAISRLKVVEKLMALTGPRFYCSTNPRHPRDRDKARAILKRLAPNLTIDKQGVLRDIFHESFFHNRDKRIIKSLAPFSEMDAAFLMNYLPASRTKTLNLLSASRAVSHSPCFPVLRDLLAKTNKTEADEKKSAVLC